MLTAEATPKLPTDDVDVRRRGPGRAADDVDVGRDPRPAAVDLRGRHPLRDHVVEVRHDLAGVSVDTLLEVAAARCRRPPTCWPRRHTGYTTNLPLADVTGGKAWVAWEVDGEPLPADHGGPARLLVPHLYFWKSAKWVAGLRLLDHDEPGFWERNGYHDRGDPWLEQRYQGD